MGSGFFSCAPGRWSALRPVVGSGLGFRSCVLALKPDGFRPVAIGGVDWSLAASPPIAKSSVLGACHGLTPTCCGRLLWLSCHFRLIAAMITSRRIPSPA